GADGLRSVVADAVAAPVLWRGEAATNVLYGYVADLPAAGYEWYYGAGVGAGLIPTHDGLTCVFNGKTRRELDRLLAVLPPAAALTCVAMRLPGLGDRLAAGGEWSAEWGRQVPTTLGTGHSPDLPQVPSRRDGRGKARGHPTDLSDRRGSTGP